MPKQSKPKNTNNKPKGGKGRPRRTRGFPRMKPLMLTPIARNTVTTVGKHIGEGAISRAITLPGESKPLRYNTTSTQGAVKSAVAKLSGYKTLSYQAGVPSFMLTHSPLNPVWGTGTFDQPRGYTWGGILDVNAGVGGALFNFTGACTLSDLNAVPCYPMNVEPGRENNDGNIAGYAPDGVTCTFTIVGTWSGTGSGFLKFLEFRESSVSALRTISVAFGTSPLTVTYTKTQGCWFVPVTLVFPGTVSVTSGSLSLALTVPTGTYFGPIMPMPSLAGLSPVSSELRTNSASLLLTNTSAKLYANGAALAARLDWKQHRIFTPSLAIAAVGEVTPELRYSGKADRGVYTYMVPTYDSLRYSDYSNSADPGPVIAFNQMGDFLHVNYITLDVAFDVGSKLSLLLRYDAHVEFRTTLQMYPLLSPTMREEELTAIMTACGGIVPFSENFTHVAMFLELARRMARLAAPYLAPYARRVIKAGAEKADSYLAQF